MITAILCAAGKGERAGFSENKVLRELNGMCVLLYSLSAFAQCEQIDEILVVCRKEDDETVAPLLRPYPNARIVCGGASRTDSVYNALREAAGDTVLVHDAARPFVTKKIIEDCIASVKRYGSGVCAVASTDTIAIAEDGAIRSTPARKNTYAVQTPQGFIKEALLHAFECAYRDKRADEFTDESGIYACYVAPPHIFEGDRRNKKLTYAEDFAPAERVGFGIDTHAFYEPRHTEPQTNVSPDTKYSCGGEAQPAFLPSPACGGGVGEGVVLVNFITLGGIRIPSDKILKAHSDGDVLVHALMDALLSAAGLRDIGYYFPDTDERFTGADSMELLQEVMRLVAEQGFAPQNVSVSVLAETPRLTPYIERMKENIASALALSPSAVGIAAGTNEKLGYVGEGKGITCYATVMLR